MPKVRRVWSPSIDCTRSYPYPSNSNNVDLNKPMNLSGSVDDVKEWEEARCSICLETPHNAVLLKCSSHEMGCRPYMCNTSYRHSNCLDQFCKSFASHLSSEILQEIPLTSAASHRSSEFQSEPGNLSQCGNKWQLNVICPLCRGQIYGYMVLEPARKYMNSKPRSCSSETCEVQGTYSDLRKHARSEHPSVRPSEVDPSRQHDWMRMERDRDFEDLFSSINASSGVEYGRETILPGSFANLMSLFLYEIFTSIDEVNRMTSLLADSRPRVPLHDRRSGTTHRVLNDSQTSPSARWRSNFSSVYQHERIRAGRWRTNAASFRDLEANRTARWRTNLSSSSRMQRDVPQYQRAPSPGVRISSSRMPWSSQQITPTNPRGSMSSSRRVPTHQLRWRDHRWSTYNNQP